MKSRTRVLLLAALLLAAMGGVWMFSVFRGVPRVTQEGDEVVVTNTGLAMRHATLEVAIGPKSYSISLDTLPKGVTRLKLEAFDPALAGTGGVVAGASVTGTRMGGSITAYSALRLTQAGEE
ncbi:MAG: hypothetical protein WAZ94_08665 [Phycisphaerales bacterium]